MTVKAINNRLEIETTIHDTAHQIVELIAAARERVEKLGGDGEDAENRIVEMVTER